MAFTRTEYGSYFYFAPDDIGQRIAAGEFFDSHLKLYMDRLNEGDVLVDVGANIGFFTIYASLFRQAEVVAFEASKAVFELLEKNVEANNVISRTMLYNIPLYDRDCLLKYNPEWNDWPKTKDGHIDYERHHNSGGMSLIPFEQGDPYQTTKMATTLDSFQLDKVTLLKVDTQGADLRVLLGARETIDRCRPVICFEYEPNKRGVNGSGDSLNDFLKFFYNRPYRVQQISQCETAADYVAEPL